MIITSKTIKYFILCVCFFISSVSLAITPTNIIVDFGDVLGEQPTRKVLPEIGFGTILSNIFSNPLRIEEEYMDFLATIESYKSGQIMASNEDRILPKIMCDWLQGLKSPEEIKTIVLAKINEMRRSIGKRKAKLWIGITNFMFTPERLAGATIPKTATIEILQKCRRQKNYMGQRMHKIFLLTNFDLKTFELIKNDRYFKLLFDCFDGIIVSGKVYLIKPDPALFELAFEEFGIDPDHEFTIFIDDEYANIEAAMRLGKRNLRCIHYTGSKELKRMLKHLDVI